MKTVWRRGRDSNPQRLLLRGRSRRGRQGFLQRATVGSGRLELADWAADWAAVVTQPEPSNPDLGKTPEQLALEREIAELADQGREEEREAAAWRLADMIMRRTLPHGEAT
jgi:hypothetical protein